MPRPICVRCQCEFRKVKTGVFVIEMIEDPPLKSPYRIWAADLSKCLGCDHEIVSDYGRFPVVERFHPDFNRLLKQIQEKETVIYCFEMPVEKN